MLLVPLLQNTPDTANFLYFGFAVLIGLLLLYLGSLALRRRSLQRDLDLIESLKAENEARSTPPQR